MSYLAEIKNQVEIEQFKLEAILELTNSINQNQSVDKLLKIFKYIVVDRLHFKRLALFNFQNNQWDNLLNIDSDEPLNEFNPNQLLEYTTISEVYSLDPYINQFHFIIPIFHKQLPLSYILVCNDCNNKSEEIEVGSIDFLQTLGNILSVAIENKRLTNESIEQELMKKELEMAAELQSFLLPNNFPDDDRIDIDARYNSQQMVGGDYYDFLQYHTDEFMICIADVSGKGVSAALLMANFQASVRAHAKYNYRNLTLEQFITDLNKSVMNSAKGEKFITFFTGVYKHETRTLKYINAAHNYPIIVTDDEVIYLNKGTVGLGMFDEIPSIEKEEIIIPPNSVLLCFTDGIEELESEEGEQFGTDRLVHIIRKHKNKTAKAINDIIFDKLAGFKGKQDTYDDQAIIVCKLH